MSNFDIRDFDDDPGVELPDKLKTPDAMLQKFGRKSDDLPIGIEFFDATSGRTMRLVLFGSWANWIVYKHPDGQWVSLRQCNEDDAVSIRDAIKRQTVSPDQSMRVGLLEIHRGSPR